MLQKAVLFATERHFGQLRKDSILPYIVHPMEVLKRVSSYGINDDAVLSAAVLHDVIEDCEVTFSELEKAFSLRVATIVQELSKSEEEDKKAYMSGFKQKSLESVIIKIADRFCNTMDFIGSGKIDYAAKYAAQANEVIERAWLEIPNEQLHADCQKLMALQGLSLNKKVQVSDTPVA